MKKIYWLASLLLTFLFAGPSTAQEGNQDVFTPIGKYLQAGDCEKLSAWFADNLELDMLGAVNNCTRNQAKLIMKNFFTSYTPKKFTIIHSRIPVLQNLLTQIGPYLIRPEIQYGKPIDVTCHEPYGYRHHENSHYPLTAFRNKRNNETALDKYQHCKHKQKHILAESLPIGKHHSVTETATVLNRVCHGKIESQWSEYCHHKHDNQRCTSAENTKQHVGPHQYLKTSQQTCQNKQSGVKYGAAHFKSIEVIRQLYLCSYRIYSFDNT